MEIKITKSDLIKYGIMALLCVVICILMSTTCSLKNKLEVAQENITAMKDTICTIEIDNGELVKYKSAYILQSKEYADYMDITSKKIKELEKSLGAKISEISVLKGSIVQENIVMDDTLIVKNDTSEVRFHYEDKWTEIGGKTIIANDDANTTIDSVKSYVPLIVGFTEDNKIFATSENPYAKITSIDGALPQSNKKTHKSVGFKVVAGPSIIYDPIRNQVAFGIGVTAGIGWGWGYNY